MSHVARECHSSRVARVCVRHVDWARSGCPMATWRMPCRPIRCRFCTACTRAGNTCCAGWCLFALTQCVWSFVPFFRALHPYRPIPPLLQSLLSLSLSLPPFPRSPTTPRRARSHTDKRQKRSGTTTTRQNALLMFVRRGDVP